MPAAVKPTYPSAIPAWLQHMLNEVSVSPATTAIESAGAPVLSSIGKELSELLGTVFTTNPGKAKAAGIPRRLEFTGMSSGQRGGAMQMHPAPSGQQGMISSGVETAPFEVAPHDMDRLIEGGAVDLDQPSEGAVAAIQRKLAALLGAR